MRRVAYALFVGVAACEPMPPQSLADVTFPAGEVLDAHRAVQVTVDASPEAMAGWFLSLSAPDEGVMYEGSAEFAARFGVELRLRPDAAALRAQLTGPDGTVAMLVPIDLDGHAVVRP